MEFFVCSVLKIAVLGTIRENIDVTKKIKVALAGICGYGAQYLNGVLDNYDDLGIELVAAIARRPERSERLPELQTMNVPIYPSVKSFFEQDTADLLVTSSPIHLHCEETCLALSLGCNVLCEKPVAATIQEASKMIEADKASDRFAAIGYQWSFSTAIQDLKKDVMNGTLGKPVRLKTMITWPRDSGYYSRNDWAAKTKDSEGNWILDSPINNATAHFLHNMFYILGPEKNKSAIPIDVTAELYRANDVENFDTAALRSNTAEGAEVLFYTSHAAPYSMGPIASYEFENAIVHYVGGEADECGFNAHFVDGTVKKYGSPDIAPMKKLFDCIETVRSGDVVACGPEASAAQTLCINGAQDSMAEPVTIPMDFVSVQNQDSNTLRCIKDITGIFICCLDQGALISELGGIPWAKSGETIDLANYRWYPGGKMQ